MWTRRTENDDGASKRKRSDHPSWRVSKKLKDLRGERSNWLDREGISKMELTDEEVRKRK